MRSSQVIRAARVRAGLSQAHIARRAGVTQPAVSTYERGGREPSLPMLEKLVAAAGFRLDVRIAEPEAGSLPPPVDDADHGRRLLDVLSLADAIPVRAKRELTMPRLLSK
jgi:transcriptional regulator with XRE-family HTH domain